VADRRSACEVHRRRRLAETRSAGHDDELSWVQTIEQTVEIGEAGRHSGHRIALGANGFDLVERRL
jgi:hypothetical protein